MAEKRLQRNLDQRMIAGVCAGIGDYFGWPHDRTRIGYVVLSVLSAAFPGIGLYLALWFLMPPRPRDPHGFRVHHPGELD